MTYVINPYRFGADSLLTGLVAWWELNETSGTRVNSHNPGVHDLTQSGTVGYTTGKQGNAATFVAATNEYLTCAHHVDLRMGDRDFSVAGWFLINSASEAYAGIVCKGTSASSGNGWQVLRNASNQTVQVRVRNVGDTAFVETTPSNITYDAWTFFIMQFNSTTDELSLELNRGTPVTATLTGGSYASDTDVLYIGTSTVSTRDLQGNVDEVLIAHRLWTTDEKNRLYNSGNGMAYPG